MAVHGCHGGQIEPFEKGLAIEDGSMSPPRRFFAEWLSV